jgi:hypothetical protein
MVKLTKLIETIVAVVLINRAVRSGLVALLMALVSSTVQRKDSSMK